jgi:hypothetical protein
MGKNNTDGVVIKTIAAETSQGKINVESLPFFLVYQQ